MVDIGVPRRDVAAGEAAGEVAGTDVVGECDRREAALLAGDRGRVHLADGGVRCTGDVVSLEYATPASGWRVDAKERGPGSRVLVELERDGVERYVQAVCVAGMPEYTLVNDDSGGDEHTGGDD